MQKIFNTLFILTLLISSSFAEETFLSLKKNKVNVRYGPNFNSDVKYVYKKINLPIKQIDKKENFRRIIDLKNNSGWIHISQLKKILNIGQSLNGFILVVDLLNVSFRKVKLNKRKKCKCY